MTLSGGLLVAACGAGQPADTRPTEAPSTVPRVFFAERRPGGGDMLSEVRGELVLDGRGCLRVRSGGDSDAVVWPAGFEHNERGGEVRVLDRGGRVTARVGETISMGGGESAISGNGAVDERTERGLRERCPGTYWIAAPPVRMRG
jgi:hypothetical protein